jgi:hypothetical protein
VTVPGNPSFPAPQGYGLPSAAPTRPTTVTLAFYFALLSGLLTIVGSILLLMNANDLAAQVAGDAVGTDFADLTDLATDQAHQTLVTRAILGLVTGVLVLVFALFIRNAALWARILLTVFLVGAWCSNGLTVRDVAPAATKALEGIAVLLGIISIVLMYLGPTNKYAAARKRS